jgi:general transcription factor 3C polypeptide 3 (transcription factor C subunit 4)
MSRAKRWTWSIKVCLMQVFFDWAPHNFRCVSVIDSRKRRPRDAAADTHPADAPNSSLFEESVIKKKGKVLSKASRLTLPELHELERKKEDEVKRGYMLLRELWPKMLVPHGADGQDLTEREWLLEAEKLVDMFRETRNLFRTSRVSYLAL